MLQNIATIITLLFGFFAFIYPDRFAKGIYFELKGPRGRSEMRTGFGGPTILMAAYTLVSQQQAAFIVIGFFWFGAVAARIISVAIDNPNINRSYLAYLALEIVMTIFLLWPYAPI